MNNTFDLDGLGVDADYEHMPSTGGQLDDEKKTGFFDEQFKSLQDNTMLNNQITYIKDVDKNSNIDLLDLNDEDIANIAVRIFILLDPDDDNHKSINLKDIFNIQSVIFVDFNVQDHQSGKEMALMAINKFNKNLELKKA